MKNVTTKCVLAIALASPLAIAEQSGAFVGVEVGYGDAHFKSVVFYTDTNLNEKATYSYTGDGVTEGFIAGYKHFFTPFLGLRAYINVNALHGSITMSGITYSGTQLNYGANVDFLGNFIAKENIDFGGFVGLGLGGNTWFGKDIDNEEKQMQQKLTKTSFDVALNVGLRTNIAKHHGVEIVARVPFLPTTLLNRKRQYDDGSGYSAKWNLQSRYSITARYTFSF
ncbi:outer membrane beta-barrel protein [Helicobacter sp. T3_23-1056]